MHAALQSPNSRCCSGQYCPDSLQLHFQHMGCVDSQCTRIQVTPESWPLQCTCEQARAHGVSVAIQLKKLASFRTCIKTGAGSKGQQWSQGQMYMCVFGCVKRQHLILMVARVWTKFTHDWQKQTVSNTNFIPLRKSVSCNINFFGVFQLCLIEQCCWKYIVFRKSV